MNGVIGMIKCPIPKSVASHGGRIPKTIGYFATALVYEILICVKLWEFLILDSLLW